MAEVERLHSNEKAPDEVELPYRVELADGGVLLALSASAAVAYAAYYAAAREYFGKPVVLSHDGVVLARFTS